MQIKFSDLERMNLVGFFFLDLLRTNLDEEKCEQAARRLKSTVLITAGEMQITLQFQENVIVIHPGRLDTVDCSVSGDLKSLLDVALGANYMRSRRRRPGLILSTHRRT